jgi:hypothetical protein
MKEAIQGLLKSDLPVMIDSSDGTGLITNQAPSYPVHIGRQELSSAVVGAGLITFGVFCLLLSLAIEKLLFKVTEYVDAKMKGRNEPD